MTKRSEGNGARKLAEQLRADPPVLAEMTRARLEKRLVDAALGGGSVVDGSASNMEHGSAATGSARGGSAVRARGLMRGRVATGAGLLAIAAAAAVVVMTRGTDGSVAPDGGAAPVQPGIATFEAMGGEQPVRRGAFREGEPIATQVGQRVQVRFARSRIDVTPETRVEFARLRPNDVRIKLDLGRVDVAFHPRHRGAEHLTIDTPSARVEVVGTEFTVELDAAGATTVRVTEGVVRVVPLDGSAPQLVHAGARTRVIASLARPASGAMASHGAAEPGAEPLAADMAGADALAAAVPGAPLQGTAALAATTPVANAALMGERSPAVAGIAPPPGERSVTATTAAPETPTVEARFAAASRLYQRAQLEQAEEALRPLAHDAQAAPSLRRNAANMLGDIYKGWHRLDSAASEFDRACALGLDEGCYSLGGVAETLGDNDRARVAYNRYLRRAPDGALAMQARSRLCRPLGVSEACYGSVVTPYTP